MCQMWKDDVLSSTPEGQVLKVNHWLARTTLDVIGEGVQRVGELGELSNCGHQLPSITLSERSMITRTSSARLITICCAFTSRLDLLFHDRRYFGSLDSVLYPARWKELFQASWRYLPDWLTDYVEYVPTREYKRFRRTLKIIGRIAKDLIDKKASVSSEDDKASKDVMSILGTIPATRVFSTF